MSVSELLSNLTKSKALKSAVVDFEPFGELKFNHKESSWFGFLNGVTPFNHVELWIEVEHPDEPIGNKLEIIRNFIGGIDKVMNELYRFIHSNCVDVKLPKSLEEVTEMYFLSSLSLKKDSSTYWVVLEPGDVESIYNVFLRFTLVNGKIVWSNCGQ
jgi:hypothetical protein